MRTLLVTGLSGQVGEAVRERLLARGDAIVAVSRNHRDDAPGLQWRHGSLEEMPALDGRFDAILSLGPLDAFARWYAAALPSAPRVVALSSTGRHDKRLSPDPAERDLAARLAAAESALFSATRATGAEVTVLRPSLIYGRGRDRSLAPLVERARRWRLLPLPSDARGLRQPVHVDDVADAVLACLDQPFATVGRAFDLPGGETLPFDEMLRRTLAVHVPAARLLRLPPMLFALGAWLSARLGRPVAGAGVRARLSLDQVSDPGPARAAFGYQPGRFRP
jgi:nucleoside-diphosphate-sugar epimerase